MKRIGAGCGWRGLTSPAIVRVGGDPVPPYNPRLPESFEGRESKSEMTQMSDSLPLGIRVTWPCLSLGGTLEAPVGSAAELPRLLSRQSGGIPVS